MKRFCLPFICALLTFAGLSKTQATVSVSAELLKNQAGTAMPETGLVVLTAATLGTFSGPSPSSFATGSEVVLKKWDLTGSFGPGILSNTTGAFTYANFSADLNAGDLLKIYWYPSLTISSPAPGSGTFYGSFRNPATVAGDLQDGGDLWILPGESGAITVNFATSDATFLFTGGSSPASAGLASLQTVPEPTSLLAVGLGIMFFASLRHRKQRAARS